MTLEPYLDRRFLRSQHVVFPQNRLFAAIRRELLEGPLRRSTRWWRANIRRVPLSFSLHLPGVVPELSELPYARQFQLKPEMD